MGRGLVVNRQWALCDVECADCGAVHRAIIEENAGVPFVAGLECTACHKMRGMPTTTRLTFGDEASAKFVVEQLANREYFGVLPTIAVLRDPAIHLGVPV